MPLVVSTTSHQRDNASWMAQHGAAVHLPQGELTPKRLADALHGLDRAALGLRRGLHTDVHQRAGDRDAQLAALTGERQSRGAECEAIERAVAPLQGTLDQRVAGERHVAIKSVEIESPLGIVDGYVMQARQRSVQSPVGHVHPDISGARQGEVAESREAEPAGQVSIPQRRERRAFQPQVGVADAAVGVERRTAGCDQDALVLPAQFRELPAAFPAF